MDQRNTAELEPARGKSVEQIHWRASDAVGLAFRAHLQVAVDNAVVDKKRLSAEQARPDFGLERGRGFTDAIRTPVRLPSILQA
ncbi:MAG: bifunctional nuclease family protein [Armatimonadota bacterium]|nr:MAG: bifunctional nuclease family protein [Armatimonadota bacterium]